MNEPTIETVARRLDRVERENRLLKRAAVVALAVISAAVLMGQATESKPTTALEAERFVLKDSAGKTRAVWGPSQAGGYSLGFFDAAGRGRLVLGVDDAGPNIGFMDANQTSRIILTITLKGYPALGLLDANGKTRAELAIDGEGPNLSFFGAEQKLLRAKLALSGRDPILAFMNSDGKPSMGLMGSGLSLVDTNGQFRVLVSLAADGTPRFFLADRAGKPIWSAP